MDRAHQARVKNALEPEWEARFEPRSYGFRPGRSCQDAAGVLYTVLNGKAGRVWVLDADLTAAFDKIDHSFLLDQLGAFPARDLVAGWLKAGVFEAGKGFAPTEEGTPQGGIISPVLLNVALHGLEEAAGVRYRGGSVAALAYARANSPVLVRYADDFVACCHTEQQANGVRERLEGWLARRGLSLNEDKTRIVCLTQGFDFLGWNFRRYPGPRLLIKPSRAAVRKHRQRLADETRRLRGSNARAVIAALNPLIGGWTSYHRGMVSSRIFASLGSHTWKLTWKWARHSHSGKSGLWVKNRYYGAFNPSRQDNWVFGDRETGIYLRNHAWTKIRRHVTVRGTASPDDPQLADYWRYRKDKHGIPLDSGTLTLLRSQRGYCPLCGDLLIDTRHLPASPQEWQDWWHNVTRAVIRRTASAPGQQPATPKAATFLIHTPCNRSLQRRKHASTALQPATPWRLA